MLKCYTLVSTEAKPVQNSAGKSNKKKDRKNRASTSSNNWVYVFYNVYTNNYLVE